ncbi:MAG: tetratricopeptide repeat protein [Kiritimatiellia bacterium]
MTRLLLFTFSALLLFAGCSKDTPSKISARAKTAYENGLFPQAIAEYEQLLKVSGDNADIYYNIALSAYPTGDTAYAKSALNRALLLIPTGVQAELYKELLGMVCESQKDTPQAIHIYHDLANNASRVDVRQRVRSRLARLYAEQQRTDAAFALLLTSLHEAPTNATTLYNFGKLAMKPALSLHRAALDSLRQAERLLPQNSTEQKDAANCVLRLSGYLERYRKEPVVGNLQKAKTFIQQAQEAQAKKRWKNAEEFAKNAAKADPSSYEAALLYARIAVQNNHRDIALKAYTAAILLRPDANEPAFEAASLAYQEKLYAEALLFLRPAIALAPRKPLQADLMARILFAQRRSADARIWGEYYLSLITKPSAARETYAQWVKNLPQG